MATILGIGLVVLWIAGLGSATAPRWLTWFDGLAALASFAIAAFTPAYASKSTRMGEPIAVSVGLYALWVIALASGATGWLTWWTFVFACAFVGLGIACASERRTPLPTIDTIESESGDREERARAERAREERERQKPRKSA